MLRRHSTSEIKSLQDVKSSEDVVASPALETLKTCLKPVLGNLSDLPPCGQGSGLPALRTSLPA